MSGGIQMKKIILLITILLFAACASQAEEHKVDITAGLSYMSSYIWRGFDMLPDNEDALDAQFGFTLGDSGHSLNISSVYALDDTSDIDEHRITWDYTRPVSPSLDICYGINYFSYPQVNVETAEVYAGAAWPPVALHPTLKVYADYRDGEGYYVTAGVSHSAPAGNQHLRLALSAGYSDGYRNVHPGVTDIVISLDSTFDVGTVYVTPSLNYTITPEDTVNTDDGEFWAGIAATTEIRHIPDRK